MKEDIDFPTVEKVGFCATPNAGDPEQGWQIHLINTLESTITNVLVATRGYGKKDDKEVKTSTLRHFFEEVPAQSSKPVELVTTELTGLSNEYWLSFYADGKLYDKKFVFVAESLVSDNLTNLPLLKEKGILIL